MKTLSSKQLNLIWNQLIVSPGNTTLSGKKITVIGYGSIGRRITRLLEQLGAEVHIISQHVTISANNFSDKLQDNHLNSDMIVISNSTSLHVTTLRRLLESKFNGQIYIEKPIGADKTELNFLISLLGKSEARKISCGYNFRHHPITELCFKIIDNRSSTPIDISIIYNEDVRTWNDSIQWNENYATSLQGGGASLTLSHAIDTLNFLVESIALVNSPTNISKLLPIDVDQGLRANLINTNPNYPYDTYFVEVGYHSFPGKHSIQINSNEFSISGDYKNGTLCIYNSITKTTSSFKADHLRDLSIMKSIVNSFEINSRSTSLSLATSTLKLALEIR